MQDPNDTKKVQAFQSDVELMSYKLQGFAQKRILELIEPSKLQAIKAKDEHPFFQAYSICHEGTSSPKILGEKSEPITWTRKAIQSIKNIALKGVQLFKGHNNDSSTAGRRSLGEVVGETQEEIDGKLHHVVVAYHPSDVKEEVKNYDICSQEGIWNLVKEAGRIVADTVDKITGIALENSSIEKPAFEGAKRLGMIQAFEDKEEIKTTGDVRMNYEEIKPHLNFDMLKRACQDMNVFPWQIFKEDDLKKDREFGKIFDENESTKKTLSEKLEELEKIQNSNKELTRKTQLIDAKERLDSIVKDKSLTDNQKKFVVDRFNEGIEDLSSEGLNSFLDGELNNYKEFAKYYNQENVEIPNSEPKGDGDLTEPQNNPLIFED